MAAKLKQKVEEEEEIVMVGPGSDETEDEDLDESDHPEKEKDDEEENEEDKESGRKNAKAENEEEDVEEDARAGHGEDDEEEDEKSDVREGRKARRERQKRARERSRRELLFLRQRNEELEKNQNELSGRVSATESSTIDQRISSLESQMSVARNVEAEAIKQQEGDEAVEARAIQTKLQGHIDRLKQAKEQITRREASGPRVDPQLMFHAQSWIDDNPWYDPKGTTKDSRTVARLDRQIVNEGYDPKSPEYWDELTKRSKKHLPHRFKNQRDDKEDDVDEEEKPRTNGQEHKSSGPKFSTGGRERPLAKNEVFVTPERKAAMQEAGVWDDKVLRTRYLKNYQKWDRDHKNDRDR